LWLSERQRRIGREKIATDAAAADAGRELIAMILQSRNRGADRRGVIAALTAVLLVVMLVFIAFAVDIGYMQVAKSQLQRTADSAAMAATWSLVQPATSTGTDMTSEISLARSQAVSFAAKNNVLAVAAPVVDSNT